MSGKKSCEQCKFCIREDHGYSNWTVEGTYIHCAKGLHPEDGFDRFYGEDERLYFAENCSSFTPGLALDLDVDGDEIRGLTGEQLEIYKMWTGSNVSKP
jgi:hypothetical protein